MSQTLRPRVEQVMGTAIGITIVDPGGSTAVDDAFAWLRRVDETFSTYKPTSEISRISAGTLGIDDASPEVRTVLSWCDDLSRATGGRFSIRPNRPDLPALDPSGLVKGWSIDEAGMILHLGGVDTFMINAGGDILCSGVAPGTQGWPIGIRHPLDPAAVAAVVSIDHGGVATSGSYERGDHIWGARSRGLLSATVVGPDLAVSDALATAVYSDPADLSFMGGFPGYEMILIGTDQQVRWTSGLDDRISLRADGDLGGG